MDGTMLDLSNKGVSQRESKRLLRPDLHGSQPRPGPDRAAADDKAEIVAEQLVSADAAPAKKASKEVEATVEP